MVARLGAAGKKTPVDRGCGAFFGATASLVDSYEELRKRALHCLPTSGGLGLAIFLGQGMSAWMQVCAAHLKPLDIPQASCDPCNLPRQVENDIVLILASMAMHTPVTT